MYAYINGTEVVGLLNMLANSVEGLVYDSVAEVPEYQDVAIGDTYDMGVWISKKTNLPSHCLSKLQFMNRFTLTELGAIEASTDPIVKVLQRQQQVAEYIDIRDQKTVEGIGYLMTIGLITPERMTEILSVT